MQRNRKPSEIPSTPAVRVLIVDDKELPRRGITSLLSTSDSVELVGEASSGAEALLIAPTLRPDVVLMDIAMPDMDGLTATRKLKQIYPDCEVLMLTQSNSQAYLRQALSSGASGYLLKDVDRRELLSAIKTVAAGGSLINPAMLRTFVNEITYNSVETSVTESSQPKIENFGSAEVITSSPDLRNEPASAEDLLLLQRLTRREREVLVLLEQGQSNKAIASTLSVSEATVKTHVHNILEKLSLKARAQVVVFAGRARSSKQGL